MQKFKALFKRNQRTARDGDRHFEDAEDGVAPAAAKKEEESTPAPLLDPELEPQTASVSVSTTDCTLLINSAGSDCCDTRANVSSNEIKMEEEIRQLKDKIYNLDRVVAEYKLENRDLKELVKILRGYVPQGTNHENVLSPVHPGHIISSTAGTSITRPEPPCTERPHGGPYTSTVRSSVTSTMSPPDISPIALPASAEEAKFQAPIPNPSQMKRFDMWLEEQQKRATGKLGEEIISSPDTQNSEVSSIVESSLIPLVGSENPVVTDSSLLEDGKNDHPTSPKSVKSDTPSLIESAASELAKPLSEDESISSTVMLDDSATVFEQQCEAEIVETPEKDTTSIFAGEHIVELDSTLTAGTEVLKLQDHLKIVETPEKDTTSIFAGEHIVELDSTVTPGSEVLKLQDHLKKMEESQHSTNEELQATIQELTDLQTQLDVTRSEKEKCKEETSILVDYLYRQTERLQAAQTENNKLQKLLHESASNESAPDREKKLIDLLKQGQVERQDIISENLALTQKLNEAQRAKELTELQNQSLRERVRELEVTVEDVQLEKRAIEDDLQKVKEEQSSHNFEILRLNTLLDLEESKVKELKAAQAAQGNENELFTLINKVLKEKEHIEKKMTETEDVLKRTTCENTRLKQELNTLQEQINKLSEVTASAVSDLENNTKLQKSEQKLSEEKINEMDRKIEGMKQRNSVLYQDLQNVTETLKMNEEKLLITLKQLDDVKSESLQQQLKMESECADLKQLHEDLLVAVRVANEIKTDCQWQLERTQLRVRELEEENAALTAQLDKYNKKEKETVKPLDVFKAPTTPKVPISCTTATTAPPTVPHTLKLSRPSLQCVNVKSLIESIENANKQTKPDSGNGSKAGSPQRESNPPLPLREQPLTCNKQTQQTGPAVISSVLSTASDENKDPLLTLVEKNGGSKRNALLKWVQARVQGYPNIEITNFSSSWTDGLALCALLHTYIPNKIPYNLLTSHNKQHNFRLAFNAAESVGIPTILNITDMVQQERPDWQKVMAYIKEIYTHFEVPD